MRKLLCCLLLGLSLNAAAETIKVGIVPQQSATRLAELWGPIIEQLNQNSELSFEFHTAPNIPTFERRLANGEYQLAYMNPYHYQLFSDSPGYRAVARASNIRISGLVVVAKDSLYRELGDLNGFQFAFPAPRAFAASLVVQSELKKQQLDYSAQYVKSHDSVYRSVAQGLYPAGGGVPQTLANVDPAVREQLRILWQSPGYSPHAFAVHPDLSPAQTEQVQQALLSLNQAEGKTLLEKAKLRQLSAASDPDWDDIRTLDLSSAQ